MTLERAKPWLITFAVLAVFLLAVLVVLAAFDLLWNFGEVAKNAPRD